MFLKECQAQGYIVTLIFIGLDSADLSRGRVSSFRRPLTRLIWTGLKSNDCCSI